MKLRTTVPPQRNAPADPKYQNIRNRIHNDPHGFHYTIWQQNSGSDCAFLCRVIIVRNRRKSTRGITCNEFHQGSNEHKSEYWLRAHSTSGNSSTTRTGPCKCAKQINFKRLLVPQQAHDGILSVHIRVWGLVFKCWITYRNLAGFEGLWFWRFFAKRQNLQN